jgi:hypothetical protein
MAHRTAKSCDPIRVFAESDRSKKLRVTKWLRTLNLHHRRSRGDEDLADHPPDGL